MSKSTEQPRYAVIIQWDAEDQIYIASLPEWGPYCKTHGDTYEEAAKNAREVLELLMEKSDRPKARPVEKLFREPGADVAYLKQRTSTRSTRIAVRPKSRRTV